MRLPKRNILLQSLFLALALTRGQSQTPIEVQLRLEQSGHPRSLVPPAVLWLKPLPDTSVLPTSHGHFTLLQKNRMFTPHLLVVPVGSVVQFPNADPFYHNVFSLFDGKRFDLGLYEAGSTKAVTFSREGVSYIFCNIHPEMSAVVLALSTRLYAIADAKGVFHIHGVSAGEYELRLWIEGMPEPELEKLTRRIHITAATGDLGELTIPSAVVPGPATHLNKFGRPYDQDAKPIY